MRSTRNSVGWLLFLYSLPAKMASGRVSLWRKLKKLGSYALKTSAYVLPNEPSHIERFQWLAQQVRDSGGEATLAHVTHIEGLSDEELARCFNDARAEEYSTLIEELNGFIRMHSKSQGSDFADALAKLQRRFSALREIDYFDCPAWPNAEMLLQRASSLSGLHGKRVIVLETKAYQRKSWITRPRPEIDRVGSAWLIRKFIDPRARFVFASQPQNHPTAIPYDMLDVEFTHHADNCTFETLLKRFGIADPVARRIGEMVHEADLADGKFQRSECVGLDLLFKGWARLDLSDSKILEKGFSCFDALYAVLNSKQSARRKQVLMSRKARHPRQAI